MVTLSQAQASNGRISQDLPEGLVAVFVGGTSGIGEYALRALVKYARNPKIYIVGRAQAAADTIIADCQKVCPGGEFVFIQADISEIKKVDEVCQDIKSRESAVNLLFMTQGTLILGKTTSEGISLRKALVVHSRARFIANLLPLLQKATGLRRVVSVMTGAKEGHIDADNVEGNDLPLTKIRGHNATTITLYMEAFAKQAPTVSFVHTFPGAVRSGIARGAEGIVMRIAGVVFQMMLLLSGVPEATSGELHLFAATSARYAPKEAGESAAAGVLLQKGATVAKGSNGEEGSGMYSIGQDDEPGSAKTMAVLAQLRNSGLTEKIMEYIEGDFKRVTGSLAI
ncbi:putative short-chain dehydrogenases/reductase [Thozetella sp. PMI_491]|nr:putative short-chain dehydrogenases/reductase [Thozetella sp. PMI_491]